VKQTVAKTRENSEYRRGETKTIIDAKVLLANSPVRIEGGDLRRRKRQGFSTDKNAGRISGRSHWGKSGGGGGEGECGLLNNAAEEGRRVAVVLLRGYGCVFSGKRVNRD